jgi:hypothetical protein
MHDLGRCGRPCGGVPRSLEIIDQAIVPVAFRIRRIRSRRGNSGSGTHQGAASLVTTVTCLRAGAQMMTESTTEWPQAKAAGPEWALQKLFRQDELFYRHRRSHDCDAYVLAVERQTSRQEKSHVIQERRNAYMRHRSRNDRLAISKAVCSQFSASFLPVISCRTTPADNR